MTHTILHHFIATYNPFFNFSVPHKIIPMKIPNLGIFMGIVKEVLNEVEIMRKIQIIVYRAVVVTDCRAQL